MAARILTICTGNICRSPVAERLLQARLPDPEVMVESAGVGAVVGAPIAEGMVDRLRAAGARVDGFAARQVTPGMVDAADLVLALTRAHRAVIAELAPSAVRRTFTLREFAQLSSAVGPQGDLNVTDRLRALVAAFARARASTMGDLDVVDPWRRDPSVYAVAFDDIDAATAQIGQALRG